LAGIGVGFDGGKDLLLGALDVLGEIDLRPGEISDIFVTEATSLDHGAQYFVVGFLAVFTAEPLRCFIDEEREVCGGDFEEADGFPEEVSLADPLLSEVGWALVDDGDEHGIVVMGGEVTVDEESGWMG